MKVSSTEKTLINKLDINPFWVEPIAGLLNRFTFKDWMISLQFDMGGFNISNKTSFMTQIKVHYRLGNLCSMKLGWTDWQSNFKGSVKGEELTLKSHLSGPTLGIGFHF